MKTSFWLAPICAGLLAACGGDTPTMPGSVVSGSAALNRVVLAPEAALLAAGDTMQLALSATALDNSVLSSLDTVIYTSADSTRVKVSATGLVTAATGPKAVTVSPIRVIASARRNGITRADTCYVAVAAAAGTAPSLSIADAAAATAKLPVNVSRTISPKLTYTAGGAATNMSGSAVPIKITVTPTSPAAAAATSNVAFLPYRPAGTVFVQATSRVFGVTVTDTITYTLGDPISSSVVFSSSGLLYFQGAGQNANYTLSGTTLYLQKNGTITFTNSLINTPYILGVKFTALEGGPAPDSVANLVGVFTGVRAATVTFANVGKYTYTWTQDASKFLPADKLGATIIVR